MGIGADLLVVCLSGFAELFIGFSRVTSKCHMRTAYSVCVAPQKIRHIGTEGVGIPVFGGYFDCCTVLTEVLVTGIEIVPNLYTRYCYAFLLGCTPAWSA